MEQNQETGTVTPVGDAAQQNATPTQTESPTSAQQAPPVPVETDAERGLRQGIEAERKKRQEMEVQLAQSQQVINQLAGSLRQSQPSQPVAEPDPLGLSDSDLLDPAKVRQGLLKVRQDAIAAVQSSVAQLQFKMQYPDFSQVVGTTDPTTGQFVPSEIMREVFEEDPSLQSALVQLGPGAPLAAYKIASQQKRLRELRQATKTTAGQVQAQEATARSVANTVDARLAPMSPSAVGGPPSTTPETDYLQIARNNPKAFEDIIQAIASGKHG